MLIVRKKLQRVRGSMATDQLNSIEMVARYTPRNQTAAQRVYRVMAGDAKKSELSAFLESNVPGVLRLRDFNPPIQVCAILLLNNGVEPDPEVIVKHPYFDRLLSIVGVDMGKSLQKTRGTLRGEIDIHRDADESKNDLEKKRKIFGARLMLLEVFTYMVVFSRARAEFNTAMSPVSEDGASRTVF